MKKFLLGAGAAVCAALLLFSGWKLYGYFQTGKQNSETYARLSEQIVPTETDSEPEPSLLSVREKYAEVFAQNEDCIGWISIDGTPIDYPVMQSKENPDFYLHHGFDKAYSVYGCPFVQENCDISSSDNLIIYGHHMINGSMFSALCNYTDKNYYLQHKIIRFDTLYGYGTYEIVAVFKTVAYSASGFPFQEFVNAASQEDFDAFLDSCNALALYDTGSTAHYGDRLITLATCEYSRKNGRMVVVAKKIDI